MSQAFTGGGGSGKKFACGTILLSNATQTISITGLGFRPDRVTIQAFRNADGNLSNNTISAHYDSVNSNYFYVALQEGSLQSHVANIISTNSDGFTAAAPSSYPFAGYESWFPILWTAEKD